VKDMNWHRNHLISQLIVTQAEAEASEKVFLIRETWKFSAKTLGILECHIEKIHL
jgi:hypothetical protein